MDLCLKVETTLRFLATSRTREKGNRAVIAFVSASCLKANVLGMGIW